MISKPTSVKEPNEQTARSPDSDSKELLELKQKMSEVSTAMEKMQRKKQLLETGEDITRLSINNNMLNEIYDEAHKKAKERYYDAKLSYFTILVYPYSSLKQVSVFMDFFSKLANKVYSFYSPMSLHLSLIRHQTKRLQDLILMRFSVICRGKKVLNGNWS